MENRFLKRTIGRQSSKIAEQYGDLVGILKAVADVCKHVSIGASDVQAGVLEGASNVQADASEKQNESLEYNGRKERSSRADHSSSRGNTNLPSDKKRSEKGSCWESLGKKEQGSKGSKTQAGRKTTSRGAKPTILTIRHISKRFNTGWFCACSVPRLSGLH